MYEYWLFNKETRVGQARARIIGLIISLTLHSVIIYGLLKAKVEIKILPFERERIQTVVLSPGLRVPLPKIVGGRISPQPTFPKDNEVSIKPSEFGGEARIAAADIAGSEVSGTTTAIPGAESAAIPALSKKFSEALSSRPKTVEKPGLSITLGQPGSPPISARGTSINKSGLPPDLISGLPGSGSGIASWGRSGGWGTTKGKTTGQPFKSQHLGISIPAVGIDFSAWAGQVMEKIQKNWVLPKTGKLAKSSRVRFSVLIKKTGELSSIEIIEVSSIESLDEASLGALRASLPFPPLPDNFPGDLLEVLFEFRYHD